MNFTLINFCWVDMLDFSRFEKPAPRPPPASIAVVQVFSFVIVKTFIHSIQRPAYRVVPCRGGGGRVSLTYVPVPEVFIFASILQYLDLSSSI